MGFGRMGMFANHRHKLGALVALIALGMGVADAAARTNRALLVGVTKYDNLPENEWLAGPANDAELVRDYLMSNPVSPFVADNVTVLTTDLEGTQKPTRAAIMTALDDLAAKAEAGDLVYVQFSGHGTRQPASDLKTEIDGKDEIFLPMDVGRFDTATGKVPNAIIDDEIGEKLDAIRDKGAFVWFVNDSCHSGTSTRNLSTAAGERYRQVLPETLGITPDMFPKVETTRSMGSEPDEAPVNLIDDDGQPDGKRGGMVAFYAARTVEKAPEMPMPEGDPSAKQFGVFTYTMMQRLAQNPAGSYRQLAEAILQEYAAAGRTMPTPMFEGDLDAPVLGVAGDQPLQQWKIAVVDGIVQLPAGRLNRVEPGTKLAILPGPQSSMDETLGYLDVRSATNMTSQLLPSTFRERAALSVAAIPKDAYARVAETSVNFEIKVAQPDAAVHPEQAAMVTAALDAITKIKGIQVKLKSVATGEPADIRMAVASESEIDGQGGTEPRLWFLPSSGEISLDPGARPPSLDILDTNQLTTNTIDYLTRISRAMNLSRLAGTERGVRGAKVEFLISRECTLDGDHELIEAGRVPVIEAGDCITLRAENNSRMAVDLNILHISNDYRILVARGEIGGIVFPIRMEKQNKLPELKLLNVSEGGRMGAERIIAVLTEAVDNSTILDLSYMAQPALRATNGPGFAGLLADAANPPKTRDSGFDVSNNRPNQGAVLVFPFETRSANE